MPSIEHDDSLNPVGFAEELKRREEREKARGNGTASGEGRHVHRPCRFPAVRALEAGIGGGSVPLCRIMAWRGRRRLSEGPSTGGDTDPPLLAQGALPRRAPGPARRAAGIRLDAVRCVPGDRHGRGVQAFHRYTLVYIPALRILQPSLPSRSARLWGRSWRACGSVGMVRSRPATPPPSSPLIRRSTLRAGLSPVPALVTVEESCRCAPSDPTIPSKPPMNSSCKSSLPL